MSELLPRLWPFLYHNSSSVRGSTLRTLETLTASANSVDVSRMTVLPAQDVGIKTEAKLVVSESVAVKNVAVKADSEHERKDHKVMPVKPQSEISEVEKENLSLSEVEKDADQSAAGKVDCSDQIRVVSGTSPVAQNKDLDSSAVKFSAQETEADSVVSKQESVEDNKAHCLVRGTLDNSSQSADTDAKCASDAESPCGWIRPIIQPALTHIYQRALLEQTTENLELVFKVRVKLFENLFLKKVLYLEFFTMHYMTLQVSRNSTV